MAEVAEVRGTNGLTVVSTFSGCGGSCLGFEMAGYRVLWASEFVEAARDTYALNHPGVILDGRDIRDVTARDILKATGKKVGEVDVMEGSPPCASFSMSGKREKAWGKVKKYSDREQRSDDLFFEFVRLLDGVKPRAFVAENVAGLVRGPAWGYFELILAAMRRIGYRVKARVLDAQWLGVPQARQRLIFVGVREDLGIDPVHPSPLPYRYSIRDALPWVGSARWDSRGSFDPVDFDGERPIGTITASSANQFRVREIGSEPHLMLGNETTRQRRKVGVDQPAPTIMADGIGGVCKRGTRARLVAPEQPSPAILAHGRGYNGREIIASKGARSLDDPCPTILTHARRKTHSEISVVEGDGPSLEGTAVGREYRKTRRGSRSDKYQNLMRPHEDSPCYAVTAMGGSSRGVASVVHPLEPRKFTIAELRRLCGFPDDFQLTGTYGKQWERLGRSVPPVMMRAVAETLRDRVLLPSRGR